MQLSGGSLETGDLGGELLEGVLWDARQGEILSTLFLAISKLGEG